MDQTIEAAIRKAIERAGLFYNTGSAGLEDFAHRYGDCYVKPHHPYQPDKRVCGDPRCQIAISIRIIASIGGNHAPKA